MTNKRLEDYPLMIRTTKLLRRRKHGCSNSTMATSELLTFKERGGGQNFSTSFWMRFRQAPLCRYRFKVIFDDIIFLLSGNIIQYICL